MSRRPYALSWFTPVPMLAVVAVSQGPGFDQEGVSPATRLALAAVALGLIPVCLRAFNRRTR